MVSTRRFIVPNETPTQHNSGLNKALHIGAANCLYPQHSENKTHNYDVDYID